MENKNMNANEKKEAKVNPHARTIPDEAEGTGLAKGIMVQHRQNQFTLSFVEMESPGVTISPARMKALAKAINENIQNYERDYGPIETSIGSPELSIESDSDSQKQIYDPIAFENKYFGMWSDMTDEEKEFFDELREESNKMFSRELHDLSKKNGGID